MLRPESKPVLVGAQTLAEKVFAVRFLSVWGG